MNILRVVLIILVASFLGGLCGYSIANNQSSHDIAQLQQERDRGLVRERELYAQLQEALAEHATLVAQTRHVQEDLQDRLRRLEDTAAALATSVTSEPDTPDPGTKDQERSQGLPLP
jgi:septal ring factor EnvC (AmiA/AmiB activator)